MAFSTPSFRKERSITPLRQRTLEDMQMCNLSPNTQTAYIRAVVGLAEYYRKSPNQYHARRNSGVPCPPGPGATSFAELVQPA